MTIPAPTLFQNEAANLTRSLRCSVELLSKCSSSRMSVLLKYAVPVCCLEHSLPNAHRHLEEAVDDGDARHAVAPSSKLVWVRRSRHRCQQRSCVFMADFWQSRRLWFSQQVRLAIFCLGVSAGGDYFDNTFLCVHLHSVICSSFGLNTHVGDANFLIVTTGEFRPVARHSSPNHYGCYVIVADNTNPQIE